MHLISIATAVLLIAAGAAQAYKVGPPNFGNPSGSPTYGNGRRGLTLRPRHAILGKRAAEAAAAPVAVTAEVPAEAL